MYAVVYIRVSTEDQALHGYSLDGQERVGLELANKLGATQIAVFRDEGISGSVLERPGLQEALDIVQSGGVHFFIVYDPDRLSRVLAHQLLLTEVIEKTGCRLHFVNFERERSAEGNLFYAMRGAIAEYERAKFILRSKFGKIQKAKRGLLTHDPGTYGYNYINGEGRLEIDEEQAAMYLRMVSMTQSGSSPEEIERRFNEQGYPGPGGGRWYRASIRRILKNPAYKGTMYLNRVNTEGLKTLRASGGRGSPKVRPKGDWIPVPIPPLITQEEWEALQHAIQLNKKGKRGIKINKYLLSNIVYCGACGYSMHGSTVNNGKGKTYSYYRCGRKSKDNKSLHHPCQAGTYVQVSLLEREVWQEVKTWILDPEGLMEEIRNASHEQTYHKEKELLTKKLDRLSTEENRIISAYRKGLIEIDTFEQEITKIKNRKKDISERQKHIIGIEMVQQEVACNLELLKGKIAEVQGKVDGLTFEDRKHLIRLLISKITVTSNEVTIETKIR